MEDRLGILLTLVNQRQTKCITLALAPGKLYDSARHHAHIFYVFRLRISLPSNGVEVNPVEFPKIVSNGSAKIPCARMSYSP